MVPKSEVDFYTLINQNINVCYEITEIKYILQLVNK